MAFASEPNDKMACRSTLSSIPSPSYPALPRCLLLLLLSAFRSVSTSPPARRDSAASSFFLTQPSITVNTSCGAVVGLRADGYNAFLGIPYGESTGGKSRFKAPKAKSPWKSVLNATAFRDGCVGGNMKEVPPQAPINYTEDCLHLNIWAPAGNNSSGDRNELFPVVVWIHGGGFQSGSASDAVYDARNYAKRGAVAVNIEYRLGVFGFLYASGVTEPNLGIQDQQLALRWVAKNIRSFGGDPDRVTLHGQSAGAMSVMTHLSAPGSQGLFHAAIVRSPVGLHYLTPDEAKTHFETIIKLTRCRHDDLLGTANGIADDHNSIDKNKTLDCLQSLSVSELLSIELVPEYIEHLTTKGFGINFLQWLPTVDGSVVTEQPMDSAREGKLARLPMILGNVMNETDAFLPSLGQDKILGSMLFRESLRLQFGMQNASAARDAEWEYHNANGTYDENGHYQTMLWSTDLLFRCYVARIAEYISVDRSRPTYLYEFRHALNPESEFVNKHMKLCVSGHACCHAGDNVFSFGTYNLVENVSFTSFEKQLSEKMLDVFAFFVRNHHADEYLIRYSNDSTLHSIWGDHGQVLTTETRNRKAQCEFWRRENAPPHLL
mmetsp:Transcript_5860/g.14211  ORF Transcript_5860/g.14211 Transcript_5860/m.14211 type:complete len:606 (-) Transcript_5860:51-1868(-)